MSLPPGFLDELRNRISLAHVVGRKVTWDMRKSNQGKGDMWAPCPFHQEKTASFHVDDRKGYYYCFGCHAKGDAIGFVKETENVGFMEAVEILAREAGMQMPARDPQAQAKTDRRTQMAEVMEDALRFFRMQLKTAQASEARAYLERRKLGPAALDRFEIGFAPDAWQGLWDHLSGKGVAAQMILDCGLARPSNRGGKPYDTFRNRIIFPIRDARGRCIAFGGRAMDPGDNAKYLNSPETELFDKGRSLFNHGPARAAAGKGRPLIVAEGYMDVIALVEAGFESAVAPLGTAITEDQLQLLWRMHPEPVVALDGDTAGLRAAMRLIDLALPMIAPDRSLRFALMPGGQDPDDLIRAGGAGAMQKVLDGAEPLVNLLWRRETEGKVFDSPERRAALDLALRTAVDRIKDPSLRRHYGQVLNDMRFDLFRGQRQAPRRRGWQHAVAAPRTETRTTVLAAGAMSDADMRIALILATLCLAPALLDDFEHALEHLSPDDPEQARLAGFLLGTPERDPAALSAALDAANLRPTLENLLALGHVRIAPCIRAPGDLDKAARCLAEEFAKLTARRGTEVQYAEAREELEDSTDDRLNWRLNSAVRHRLQSFSPKSDSGSEVFGDDDVARKAFKEMLERAESSKKTR